jgi:hypothetical protein
VKGIKEDEEQIKIIFQVIRLLQINLIEKNNHMGNTNNGKW